jgi:IS1 family transposase
VFAKFRSAGLHGKFLFGIQKVFDVLTFWYTINEVNRFLPMANHLPTEKKILAVSMLCENSSIRAIERVTGIHRDTIMRLGVRMGEGCRSILDERMHGLDSKRIEIDEMWGFLKMKEKQAKAKGLSGEFGHIWTWIAMDADSKVIPCFAVGDRSAEMCDEFIADLAPRLKNRVQITTDGMPEYRAAIEKAFGGNVDYGSLVKTYSTPKPESKSQYSSFVASYKTPIEGNLNMELLSTSYIEKQNHTVRMHVRRLARKTNAFSKKRENHEMACALHFAYYNFVKSHGSIRTTPAVAAGVESRPWKIAELVERIEA